MNKFWVALLAGFIGSVSTFVITRLGVLLNRIRKRNVLNYNALVRLEHLANEWGGVVNDNRQNLETIIDAMSKPRVLPLNRLGKIPAFKDLKLHLLDLDLINRQSDVEISLRRINDDAEIMNNHLDSFQGGVINKTLNPEEYKTLLGSMLVEAKFLLTFYESFLDDLAELAAHARLKIGIDKTISIRVLGKISSFKKRAVTTKEIEKEKNKVLVEIESNRKKSLKRKAEIEKKTKTKETNL